MNHKEGEFIGQKNLKIYYQSWVPDRDPKAIVQVFHGFAEHSGRYMNVVNKLVPLGYAVYINDHRGHGKSEGITNYVDSFDQYIKDGKTFFNIIRDKYPNLPHYILGHSMGSGIAIYFALEHQNEFEGLILSGAGNRLGDELSGFLKFMSKILAKIAPKMKIDPKLDPETLSHDPEVVRAYQEDPLVHHKIVTTRLGYAMLKKFEMLDEVVEDLELPLLVQCGSDDKAVQGIKELKDHFLMDDKTIIIYDDLYHEVYNEIKEKREKVLKDLAEWLNNHVS